MRKTIVAAVVLCLVAVAGARPFHGQGGGGWGPAGAGGRLYDPKTVETVQGTVQRIEVTKSRGMTEGIHVLIATPRETIPVHLGPAWYLEHQDVVLAVGDRVTVRGSRIMFEGKPAIIAAEVTRGDEILVLRDEQGFPRWAGWRHRSR